MKDGQIILAIITVVTFLQHKQRNIRIIPKHIESKEMSLPLATFLQLSMGRGIEPLLHTGILY